jgi:hypothetical protein
MKQYVIDELTEADYHRIRDYLQENLESAMLDGIYWVNLPDNLYNEIQLQHPHCRPFYFAINLSRKQISFEWLIRSRQTLHCPCIGYANAAQRDYIIDYADALMERLETRV